MDDDLMALSREQLIDEVRKLRDGVRKHRDASGHDLCWHHPALWSLLPEPTAPAVAIPDWPQFMRGCVKYRQSLDEQLPRAPRTTQEFQSTDSGVHKSRLATIVIDCQTEQLDEAADFWSKALGWEVRVLADSADANYRELDSPAAEINVLVQSVAHPSRVHLDIETNDIEAEVRRLETLGAKRVAQIKRWWVMEAPTGQRFCVVRPQRSDFETHANVWPQTTESKA
jgi:predicted enzyme related to lactoylglutathione lyase